MATDAAQSPMPPAASGPDVLRAELDGVESRPFPRPETEYRVIFEPAAHSAIMAHAAGSPTVELCGILVGDLLRDDDGPYLVVTDIIRGRAAKEGDVSVTFTHSTWEQIHREMDRKHAGRRIVGRGECYGVTKSVGFVRGMAHDGDAADPVAHVTGTFMFTA